MELQSKDDWFALIRSMESGHPEPSAVTRAVAILKGGMEDMDRALAAAGEVVEQWPATREDAMKLLGRNTLLQDKIRGHRHREAVQTRRDLKAIKVALLANYFQMETTADVMKDMAVASMGLQGTAREIMAQLDTAAWAPAAERMRQYWDTAEAMTKRLSRMTGA